MKEVTEVAKAEDNATEIVAKHNEITAEWRSGGKGVTRG